MGALHKTLRDAMKDALRIIYPPQCLACGEGVVDEGALCPGCWSEAEFITGPCCGTCGAPVPGNIPISESHEPDTLCDECLSTMRPWQAGAAAMIYGGTARRLVLALKHGDRPDLSRPLANWLHRAAAPLIQQDTIVIPVPVHWRRLVKRKYNQSELLSAHLARQAGLLHLPDALQRVRHTASQDHKNVVERFANIADAIQVKQRHIPQLQGRPVLLVDDVLTSGATLSASARALTLAGSGTISVVVLARAVKDH